MSTSRRLSCAGYTVIPANGGGYNPSHPGIEASVDLQVAQGMAAYPTRTGFFSTGEEPNDDSLVAWLNFIPYQEDIPHTIGSSYGNYEHLNSIDYAGYVCHLFAQLGVRRVSVLFSSGDHGVGEGDCSDGDGPIQFTPLFHATCAYAYFLSQITCGSPRSQVPMSLLLAERRVTVQRSQGASPVAASRTTLYAQTTSSKQCPPPCRRCEQAKVGACQPSVSGL